MLNTRRRPLLAVMLVLDAACVPLSLRMGYFLAEALRTGARAEFVPQLFWSLSAVTIPILWAILWNRRLYDSMRQKPYYDILLSVTESIGILLIIFSAVLFYISKKGVGEANVSGWVIALFMLAMGALILGLRFGLKYLAELIRTRSLRNLRRLLIVGVGDKALEQQRQMYANRQWGYWIVGFLRVRAEDTNSAVDTSKILGNVDEIDKVIDEAVVDEVMFAISVSELPYMAEAIRKCEEVGVTFHLAADFLDTAISRIELKNMDGKAVLSYSSASTDMLRAFVKRAFDIVFSIIVMIVCSWIFLLGALFVRLTSKGPVFFKQPRVSLNGRVFTLCKFRSMIEGAENRQKDLIEYNEMKGPVFKIKDDPRITPIGKLLRRWSIDELPQFWNVLKGDMSVVGPRPLPTYEVARFERWQRRRLSMKPGITCIWQIKGRNRIYDFNEWMKLDLEYIDNWTLGLDWKIILLTIPVIFMRRGAH